MSPPFNWWRHETHVRKIRDYERFLRGQEERENERRLQMLTLALTIVAGIIGLSLVLFGIHLIWQ